MSCKIGIKKPKTLHFDTSAKDFLHLSTFFRECKSLVSLKLDRSQRRFEYEPTQGCYALFLGCEIENCLHQLNILVGFINFNVKSSRFSCFILQCAFLTAFYVKYWPCKMHSTACRCGQSNWNFIIDEGRLFPYLTFHAPPVFGLILDF